MEKLDKLYKPKSRDRVRNADPQNEDEDGDEDGAKVESVSSRLSSMRKDIADYGN